MAFLFLIHTLVLLLILYYMRRKFREAPLAGYFWLGVVWKILAGILLGLIYFTFYDSASDTFIFQKYSIVLTNILWCDPAEYFRIMLWNNLNENSQDILFYTSEPRAFFFLKVLSLLNILTFDNYWLNTIYLSLFSFLGSWIIANSLVRIYQLSKPATAFSFLLLPSYVFWTSGVLKESFVIGSLWLVTAFILQYIHLKRKILFHEIIFLLLLTYCCWKIKFYYAMIAIPALLSYAIAVKALKGNLETSNKFKPAIVFTFVFLVLTVSTILFYPSFSLNYFEEIIFYSYDLIYKNTLAMGKTAYELEGMAPAIGKILQNAPEALFTGLFRPFIWESPLNFTLLSALENLMILSLFLLKMLSLSKSGLKWKTETFAVLTYICLTATLMALIGPNWGTLSRYKVAYISFWLLILTHNNPVILYLENRWKEQVKWAQKSFHF